MSSGIVRQLDDLGRIVIPAEIRSVLGIRVGDGLEICKEGNKVVMQLYVPGRDEEDLILRVIQRLQVKAGKTAKKKAAINSLKAALTYLEDDREQ